MAEGLLTEEQVERLQERAELGLGKGAMPGGAFGFRGRGGGRMPGHGHGGVTRGPGNSLIALAADDLGMDVEDLLADLRDGKTVAELGGDVDAIVDAHLAQMAERFGEAQANGRITEEQAASMLEQMREGAEKWLTEPLPDEGTCPGGGWHGAPGRTPGRLWGFPGQNDA